jgi:hypothetical protein
VLPAASCASADSPASADCAGSAGGVDASATFAGLEHEQEHLNSLLFRVVDPDPD